MQNRILDSFSIEPVNSCSHLNNETTIFFVTEAKNLDVIFSFNDFNPPAPLDQESLELLIYVCSHLILIRHHTTCHTCPELLNHCPRSETLFYWKLAVELSLSSGLFFLLGQTFLQFWVFNTFHGIGLAYMSPGNWPAPPIHLPLSPWEGNGVFACSMRGVCVCVQSFTLC